MKLADYWNIQVYLQGELVSIDIVEAAEVQPMVFHLENRGYEVRSEPAWKPTYAACHSVGESI